LGLAAQAAGGGLWSRCFDHNGADDIIALQGMRAKRYATFSVNPALLTAAFLIVDLGFVEANLDLDRWRDSLNPLTAAGFTVYLVRRYS
jgi:hypothetical protein